VLHFAAKHAGHQPGFLQLSNALVALVDLAHHHIVALLVIHTLHSVDLTKVTSWNVHQLIYH
jgi:hypothetical protein